MADAKVTPIIVRSQVQSQTNYHRYREHLRWDFWFSCAYCSIAETEARGIGFEIDHYEPQAQREDLINDYGNLMWSCSICNKKKGDLPDEDTRSKGYRFVRPDSDDPRDHFRLNGERVEGKTKAVGVFTEKVLNLNSHHLRRLRRIRETMASATDEILLGIRVLERFRMDQITSKERRAQFLKARADISKQAKSLDEYVGDALSLRELNRSELIDNGGQESAASTRERRQYLREIHVWSPNPWRTHDR